MNPAGNVPIIEMSNGKILTQSYPILRRWARQLDAYDGKTEDEKYWVDAICDIVVDCTYTTLWEEFHGLMGCAGRTLFIAAFFASNKQDYEKHKSGDHAHYLRDIEQKLRGHDFTNRGPYIVVADITYADLVLYQICHDEGLTQNGGAGLHGLPRLLRLVEAVEGRPNIKKFMESDSNLG